MIYQRKENSFRMEHQGFVFNGNRTDPYGFWTVTGKKDKKPVDIPGEFTSCDDAIKAVERKLNELKVPEDSIA